MRKFLFALLAPAALLLASCLNVEQVVERDGSEYSCSYKFLFSKSLLELAQMDSDELFSQMDTGEFPENASFERVETADEVGFRISCRIASDTEDADERSMLPFAEGNSVLVPLLGGDSPFSDGNEAFGDSEEMLEIALSNAKWTVFVAEGIVSGRNSAAVVGSDGSSESVPCSRIGSMVRVEVPLSLLGRNPSLTHIRFSE